MFFRHNPTVSLFEWTPSKREKSGYPVIRDFASRPGQDPDSKQNKHSSQYVECKSNEHQKEMRNAITSLK